MKSELGLTRDSKRVKGTGLLTHPQAGVSTTPSPCQDVPFVKISGGMFRESS